MNNNKKLRAARINKNDEFYTRLCDIEDELIYYRPYFKGKVVYCNCDNPKESNFFKYFVDNFKELCIKKVVATGFNKDGVGCYGEYSGDEVVYRTLDGNGDFRSVECIEFLKEADIVVTNPPFSLFREYIKQLFEYDKEFLVIGNKNAITYKEVFPYIKNNQLWLGITNPKEFIQPKEVELKSVDGLCRWFTNILHNKRNIPLVLTKNYYTEKYPKYDNYNAVEVSKVADIPKDYDGVMGVPITFLNKYCPEQFEIDGITENNVKNNQLWLEITTPKEFIQPNNTIKKFGNIGWFTNIQHNKRNLPLDLYKTYTPADFPKYDNYDAIEVSKVSDIPMDYDGVMGVPITFLDKYCPEQFEIVKFRKGDDDKDLVYTKNGVLVQPYFRILIKRKTEDYPKYDNYDAIDVSKVADIPMDYDGVMGVPITFLTKYCPEQFEIVGITENNIKNKHLYILGCEKYDRPYLNGERKYARILIKRKK